MSRILCSHAGRFGDCLWALPTIRAISHTAHAPVDLMLPARFGSPSFVALLAHQPYLANVFVAKDWAIEEAAPVTPAIPPAVPEGYERVVHLGARGWPLGTLASAAYQLASEQTEIRVPLDLDTPWIRPLYELPSCRIVVGFTDEYFELKFGIYWLLRQHFVTDYDSSARVVVNVSHGPRWDREGQMLQVDWVGAAGWIAQAEVFVGCCSALHVLACGLGRQVIVLEPQKARHHPVFYPCGTDGKTRVQLVLGGDGEPTFDARHLVDAIEATLRREAVA